ncbi:hypothetical protein [uncultured Dubosiella sp.]|nr:hypothetical protein [uncultured Dubosiella sp.]
MCNLSQGILEQGMEKQRIQDEKKTQRQNIKRMKKLLAAGIDKATIASVFDCFVAELEALSPKQTR